MPPVTWCHLYHSDVCLFAYLHSVVAAICVIFAVHCEMWSFVHTLMLCLQYGHTACYCLSLVSIEAKNTSSHRCHVTDRCSVRLSNLSRRLDYYRHSCSHRVSVLTFKTDPFLLVQVDVTEGVWEYLYTVQALVLFLPLKQSTHSLSLSISIISLDPWHVH